MAYSHRWKGVGDRDREVPAQLQAELYFRLRADARSRRERSSHVPQLLHGSSCPPRPTSIGRLVHRLPNRSLSHPEEPGFLKRKVDRGLFRFTRNDSAFR